MKIKANDVCKIAKNEVGKICVRLIKVKVKVKVKLSLCLTEHHAMKAY
jgi:hypothetical protein